MHNLTFKNPVKGRKKVKGTDSACHKFIGTLRQRIYRIMKIDVSL